MIMDILAAAERYTGVHPGFREAFDFLIQADVEEMADGRVDLDGDRMYANVMSVEGVGRDAARMETHRRYIDIQYVIKGCDVMGWRSAAEPLQGMGYDAAKDIEFHRAAPTFWFEVPAGHFAVFMPEDAHASLAGTGAVRKVVVKVLVSA